MLACGGGDEPADPLARAEARALAWFADYEDPVDPSWANLFPYYAKRFGLRVSADGRPLYELRVESQARQEQARLFQRLVDPDARVAKVLAALRTATGLEPPEPLWAASTDWTHDAHARGAYSFWAAGARDDDVSQLAEPVGDLLFFAGEATSVDFQGSMAGAILSGERAAAEVLDARRGASFI